MSSAGQAAMGILNCDKPVGATSRELVDIVQRRLRPAKVGHAGTLDPLAGGVLVMGVGSASRLVPYIQLHRKTYEVTFALGRSSPSGDLEFEVTEHPELPVPTLEQLIEATQRLTGRIWQTPPLYSAVKVGGRRAYDAARKDQTIELRSRQVEVQQFDLVEYRFPIVRARVVCGSGTYIRTLGIDLASLCGSRAVMTELRRMAIGPYRVEDALSTDRLRNDPLRPLLRPPREAVSMLRELRMDADEVTEITHGRTIRPEWLPPASPATGIAGEIAAIDPEGHLRGLLIRRASGWGPKRVFPRPEEPASTD